MALDTPMNYLFKNKQLVDRLDKPINKERKDYVKKLNEFALTKDIDLNNGFTSFKI